MDLGRRVRGISPLNLFSTNQPRSKEHHHHTSTYISTGSPTPSISGITHFRSNAFASTILNIFWTFMDAEVEQKMRDACIARANLFAWKQIMSSDMGRARWTYLFGDLLLFITRKCRKLVKFCAYQEWNSCLAQGQMRVDMVARVVRIHQLTLLKPLA